MLTIQIQALHFKNSHKSSDPPAQHITPCSHLPNTKMLLQNYLQTAGWRDREVATMEPGKTVAKQDEEIMLW